MNRTIAAMLVTASALALAGPAFAQTNVDPAQQPGATVSNSGTADATPTANPAGDTGPATGNDIVVTATRRAERLQEVPLAVNAISGDDLAQSGFQNLTDIQYQLPGVQFGTSPNDSGFRLRGVGSAGGFTSSSEQNVGTVVDNVVVPSCNSAVGAFPLTAHRSVEKKTKKKPKKKKKNLI